MRIDRQGVLVPDKAPLQEYVQQVMFTEHDFKAMLAEWGPSGSYVERKQDSPVPARRSDDHSYGAQPTPAKH